MVGATPVVGAAPVGEVDDAGALHAAAMMTKTAAMLAIVLGCVRMDLLLLNEFRCLDPCWVATHRSQWSVSSVHRSSFF